MRNRSIAIIAPIVGIMLLTCGHDHAEAHSHENEHDHPHDQETAEHAHTGDDHSHTDGSEHTSSLDSIQMNQGEKWMMDDHTRAIFVKMAKAFSAIDIQKAEVSVLKQEGANLREELRSLVEGCTMTGEAHDQLHIFLAGYVPAVDAMARTGLEADAKHVKLYLEQYSTYFQ